MAHPPSATAAPPWKRVLLSDRLVLLLAAAWFAAALPFADGLASPGNLADILSSLLPLLVAAVGQTLVLLTGGIDLSATSVIALASVTGGCIMSADGGWLAGSPAAVPAGIAAMLAVGLAAGLLNGVAIVRLGMPPFIVTLAAMMFWSGFAIRLTRSENIGDLPAAFDALGGRIPIALGIAATVAIAAQAALSLSLPGRWLYAVGWNARAAAVSGVPVRRVTVAAYAASGLCAAIASVLYTARLETASPVHGQKILLDIIGAAVIGGTSLFGGKGSVVATASGVLFFAILANSLDLLGLSHFSILMVKGAVILLAALIDAARNRLAAGR